MDSSWNGTWRLDPSSLSWLSMSQYGIQNWEASSYTWPVKMEASKLLKSRRTQWSSSALWPELRPSVWHWPFQRMESMSLVDMRTLLSGNGAYRQATVTFTLLSKPRRALRIRDSAWFGPSDMSLRTSYSLVIQRERSQYGTPSMAR